MNEEVNFCNQCGSKINSDAKFCSNCGCDLQNSSTKTSLDANIKLETANVKLETTNATLEKGVKATGATLEKGVKATGATLEKGFKEVRKGLLLSTARVMGFSFKSGLTRIWIFLSVLYLIFATPVLIENIDCVGYLDRVARFQEDIKKNSPELLKRLDGYVPEETVGKCGRAYIWRIGSKQYANIVTMVGTMLGGLILLWFVPYILIFWVGRGLYWVLCWIKTGFIADPSNKPDQSEIRTKEEE